MGEGVCWTGYCLPCRWAPRTYDWMLFQGERPDSGFPLPTHTANSVLMEPPTPPPATGVSCSRAKPRVGKVCTRVFVYLCVPLSLNLCLCTQVCVYAGQCVLVSLNSYMCPRVCVCVCVCICMTRVLEFPGGQCHPPQDCPLPRASAPPGRGKNLSLHHSGFAWLFIYNPPHSTNGQRWRS